MQLLADESCDHRVVVALRAAGYDVQAVTEVAPGASDGEVLALAARTDRILVTEDRDFGRLAFASRTQAKIPGVLYIRCPETARNSLPKWIVATVNRLGDGLAGHFSTWKPGKLRLR